MTGKSSLVDPQYRSAHFRCSPLTFIRCHSIPAEISIMMEYDFPKALRAPWCRDSKIEYESPWVHWPFRFSVWLEFKDCRMMLPRTIFLSGEGDHLRTCLRNIFSSLIEDSCEFRERCLDLFHYLKQVKWIYIMALIALFK